MLFFLTCSLRIQASLMLWQGFCKYQIPYLITNDGTVLRSVWQKEKQHCVVCISSHKWRSTCDLRQLREQTNPKSQVLNLATSAALLKPFNVSFLMSFFLDIFWHSNETTPSPPPCSELSLKDCVTAVASHWIQNSLGRSSEKEFLFLMFWYNPLIVPSVRHMMKNL